MKLKHFWQTPLGKITTLAIILICASAIIYTFNRGGSPQAKKEAYAAVEKLYDNDDQTYLTITTNQEDINQAKESVKRVRGKEGKKLQEAVELAEKKFDAAKDLGTIYQVDNPLSLREDNTKDVLFQEKITSSDVVHLGQEHQFSVEDDYTRTLSALYQEAAKQLETMEESQFLMEKLPTVKDIKVRGDVPPAVKRFVFVEKEVRDFIDQPQMKEFKKALEDSQIVIQSAIDGALKLGELDPQTTKHIGDSVYLTDEANEQAGIDKSQPLKIALTFDDGPNEEYTNQVLDILKENKIKATFFVMGAYVDEHPDVARRIVKEGHEIANHTYSHPNFDDCTDEEILKEIDFTNESIFDETGYVARLYRLPFGAGGARAVRLLEGMPSILWNVDSQDWKLQDAAKIHDHVMDCLQQESILLMHDTSQYSVDALKRLIPSLKKEGYEFVKVEDIDYEMRYFE